MALPNPTPLYPASAELNQFFPLDYPSIKQLFNNKPSWHEIHWNWGKLFLEYIGRNKSEHTYTRFRNEVERFILWSFLIKEKPINEYRKSDILDYADFCWRPPVHWIGSSNLDRFLFNDGTFKSNKLWRPYKLQAPKNQNVKTVDKRKYRPSQQTLISSFTAIIAFYKYLMGEELWVILNKTSYLPIANDTH